METNSITDYLQSLRDIEAAISMGLLPAGVGTLVHKFAGRVNIGTDQVILSTCPNESPWNTTGLQLYISSEDAAATQKIYLEGIDQDYEVVSITMTLQGQTAVAIPVNFRTIWRGYNANSVDLAGDVYVGSESNPTNGVPDDDNMYCNVVSTINGKLVNQTITSIFTIPAGYTGFITRWYGVADKGDDIDFTAYTREEDEVFRYMERLQVFERSYQKELPYMRVPEKTDLKVMGASAKTNSNGSVTYDVILLNNDFLQKFRPLAWR